MYTLWSKDRPWRSDGIRERRCAMPNSEQANGHDEEGAAAAPLLLLFMDGIAHHLLLLLPLPGGMKINQSSLTVDSPVWSFTQDPLAS